MVDKKLWLKAMDNCNERWKLWNWVESNSVLVSETFSVRKTKLTDLVSKNCLGQVWGAFLLEKGQRWLDYSLIRSCFSNLQHCGLSPSPCQHLQSYSELSFAKSIRSTLTGGSFTLTVVILCLQILHATHCQATSLPVPGLKGRGIVWMWLGSSQHLLGMFRAIARNEKDSR